jgi:periplasmic divalent cation tolerance protein
MPESMIMIISNLPNIEMAQSIGRELVGQQLTACVNILPGVHSIYTWEGTVEEASEVTVLIKTRARLYAAVEQAILSRHPYDVPEILALPVQGGLPAYLSWMAACTKAAG